MRSASPMQFVRRFLPVLPIALAYGCTDAPTAVAPRAAPPVQFAAGPTVIVTNTDDAGAGSLRQAILDAPAGATIQFEAAIAGQAIVLSSGELVIDKALIIEGPVPEGMTVSGGLNSRVFWIKSTGIAVFRNLSIVDGRDKFGGGILVEGRAVIDHSLVANNEARDVDGGGIYAANAADLTLVNSTVSGNTSPNVGGGIVAGEGLSIRNSTIANNTAARGGGVFMSSGSLSLRNSIIAGNASSMVGFENCSIDPSVQTVLAGRNISDNDSCGIGLTMTVANPHLGPLANNGGPTKTHAIGIGLAVDRGLDCTESTDQRYVARNKGPTCDLGAFEFDSHATIAIAYNPSATVDTKTGKVTVSGTIVCSQSANPTVDFTVSQTQKTTGRFTTIVQAAGLFSIQPCGPTPSSWSVTLTPTSGKFAAGTATGSASLAVVPPGFLSASTTSSLKLFQVK